MYNVEPLQENYKIENLLYWSFVAIIYIYTCIYERVKMPFIYIILCQNIDLTW